MHQIITVAIGVVLAVLSGIVKYLSDRMNRLEDSGRAELAAVMTRMLIRVDQVESQYRNENMAMRVDIAARVVESAKDRELLRAEMRASQDVATMQREKLIAVTAAMPTREELKGDLRAMEERLINMIRNGRPAHPP